MVTKDVIDMTEEEKQKEIDYLVNNDLREFDGRYAPKKEEKAGLLGKALVMNKKHGEVYKIISFSRLPSVEYSRLTTDTLSEELGLDMFDKDFMQEAIELIVKRHFTDDQKAQLNGVNLYKNRKYKDRHYPYTLRYLRRKNMERKVMKHLVGNKEALYTRRFPYLYKKFILGEMFKEIRDAKFHLARSTKKLILLLDEEYVNEIVYTKISITARREIIKCYRENKIISAKSLREVSKILYENGQKALEEMRKEG